LEAKRSKQNDEKEFCFDAKRLKRNSEKIRSETMRNEAKKFFLGFAKTCENEAKQDAFRFISLRSKNLKRAKKGHPMAYCQLALSQQTIYEYFQRQWP
jgi:hypothetical protein